MNNRFLKLLNIIAICISYFPSVTTDDIFVSLNHTSWTLYNRNFFCNCTPYYSNICYTVFIIKKCVRMQLFINKILVYSKTPVKKFNILLRSLLVLVQCLYVCRVCICRMVLGHVLNPTEHGYSHAHRHNAHVHIKYCARAHVRTCRSLTWRGKAEPRKKE